MRKLVFIAIMVLLLIQTVEAKTVLYVTNSSTDISCGSLPTEDSLYCNRLEELGYDVKVINEMHVKESSSTWSNYADISDMVFLGSLTLDMINKNKSQDLFCGNISSKIADKSLFAAFESVLIDDSKNIEGCAFYPAIDLASFVYENNECSKKTFKISKSGYVTENYGLNDNLDFYSSARTIKIHEISGDAWVTAECIPPNGTIDFYPVISIKGKHVFWGLDKPSDFTEDAWEIFDKTILYSLDDKDWDITSFVIPSVATVNQDILVLANVTHLGKPVDGIVNLTADGIVRNMEYVDGLWRVPALKLNEVRYYSININAYSPSGLRGSSAIPINSGNLVIEVTSGSYKPNSEYNVSAEVFLNSKPQSAQVSFRILKPDNYAVIVSGILDCIKNICTKKIITMPDFEGLILEVTAFNYSLSQYGGNFKTINKNPLFINKEVYKPGGSIIIDFLPPGNVTIANITIIRPDGSKETPSAIPLDKVTEKYWTKNYSLGSAAPNGTYTLNLKALVDGESMELNKNFDVLAWEPYAYLNQYSFYAYENLKLTVGITDVYSSTLNFSVRAEIIDPDGKKVFSDRGSFKGDGKYSTSYLLPGDYKDGRSLVKVFLTDSYNRNSTMELNFSFNFIDIEPKLFVTPSKISETTIARKTIMKSITLENSAEDIDITNLIVNVSSSLKNIIEVKYKPSIIPAKNRGTMTISINTGDLSAGRYRGTIDFLSQVGEAQVSVDLEIIGDILSEISIKSSLLDDLEKNITELKKNLINVTEASDLLEEIRNSFRGAQVDYKSEDYVSAKAKYEEASMKLERLIPMVNSLFAEIPDYSFVIWYFAFAIVFAIIVITVIKYGKRAKKKRKKKGEKEEVEEVYFRPEHEEYRTEYY